MATTHEGRTPTETEHRARIREILDEAGTVMLITRAADGTLHPRPMAVARVDDDGTMYFATSIDAPKTQEIEADPRTEIVFQSRTRYAAVSGRARVVRDRALIEALWSEAWKLWFPEGKQDPDIAILIVEPERGEYWDQSGVRGLSFLFRAARAYVAGKEVETTADSHGKVRM